MKTIHTCLAFALAMATGCTEQAPAPEAKKSADIKEAPAKTAKRVEMGKNVTLEILPDGQRRVIVPALVCFREGPLELFLCRKHTKEHESVLVAEIDARDLHKALLAAGAVPGSPVKFEPKFEPAKGQSIKISIKYTFEGKDKIVNAREWVRDGKTRKELADNWIFAGSFFYEVDEPVDDEAKEKKPPGKRTLYAANGGDIVCVSNFGTAMLDVPVASSAENEELMFEAFTERIPPLGAKVEVIFEPVPEKKHEKAKSKN